MTVLLRLLVILATLGGIMLHPAAARAETGEVQTVWRLLDYVAVDYAGAVSNGRVASAPEYAEMTEFSATIRSGIATLPPKSERARLVAEAEGLQAAIASKAPADIVAQKARSLASELLAAYPVPLAPAKAPDQGRGAALYAENCASCHGIKGDGNGPQAARLNPPPIAFTDTERARKRSLFALYQVIDQGLDGTAMQSFANLPSDDRWALAAYVGGFAFKDVAAGERIWKNDPALRQRIPDLQAFTSMTPEALGQAIGQAKADAVLAYLRANPKALSAPTPASLAIARERLDASLKAYAAGDRKAAADLTLSAYLDGFEPVEPVLAVRDPALMARIEGAMGALRAAIGKGRPLAEVEAANKELASLFGEAEAALAPERANSTSSFLGAFGVLLREGLEALLIVVAMIAFLRKTERNDVVGFVHSGWVVALAAGVATWFVATYFIGVSGASRELTEGFGSLFAAVILVTVGIWMHGKSSAEAWQRYIKEKMTHALSKRSGWFLFLLAFVVVYREVFETILFYAALWAQGNGLAMLGGAAAAAAVLAVLAWVMLRYSARLPITQFFSWSAILIAILAVVLAGKGIAGLQEAGILGVVPLSGIPRIQVLGLFPTTETVLAQLVALAILVAGFWLNRKGAVRET